MESFSSEQVYTAACWSLTRPAVFFIGKEDGSIEVWNLLEKSKEPTRVHPHVANSKITCIEPWSGSSKQHLLAVCDDHGMARIFEIPKSLCVPSKNESSSMQRFFDLGMDMMTQTEAMWATLKKKAPEESKKKKMTPAKPVTPPQETKDEDFKLYLDDLKMEESILRAAGLPPNPHQEKRYLTKPSANIPG